MDDYSKIANLPAAAPPRGVVANFDNPPSRAHELYIGMGICITVAAILLALRLYAKFVVMRSPGWDDSETYHSMIIRTLTASAACSTGFVFFALYVALVSATTNPHGPFGTHIWDIKIGQVAKAFLQKNLAFKFFYAAAAFSIKLSLFLLYLRLFKPNRYTRWLVYGGIIICGLFYSACIISNCVLAIPTPGQPNDNMAWILRASKVGDKTWTISVIQGAIGLLSDIYLLVIPLQMIFQLHLSVRRKIEISSIFMIGILAIACSLVGLVYRVKGSERDNDNMWFSVLTLTLSAAELGAGIVCSCMPICASLLRGHIFKDLHYHSPRHIYRSLRSRSSRRPLVLDQTYSLDNLQPQRDDSNLVTLPKAYVRLEDGSGLAETNISVVTQRERLEY